jgi:hypothetical protein
MRVGALTVLCVALSYFCAIASGAAVFEASELARYPRLLIADIPLDLSRNDAYAKTFDVDLEGDYDVYVVFTNTTEPSAITAKLGTSVYDADGQLPRFDWAVESNGSTLARQERIWRGWGSYALGAIRAQPGTTYTIQLQPFDTRSDLDELGPHLRVALDPHVSSEYFFRMQFRRLACALWGIAAIALGAVGAMRFYSLNRPGQSPHN